MGGRRRFSVSFLPPGGGANGGDERHGASGRRGLLGRTSVARSPPQLAGGTRCTGRALMHPRVIHFIGCPPCAGAAVRHRIVFLNSTISVVFDTRTTHPVHGVVLVERFGRSMRHSLTGARQGCV